MCTRLCLRFWLERVKIQTFELVTGACRDVLVQMLTNRVVVPDAHPFDFMLDQIEEAKKYDPDGNYVRRWLPALARLPLKWIHRCALVPFHSCNYLSQQNMTCNPFHSQVLAQPVHSLVVLAIPKSSWEMWVTAQRKAAASQAVTLMQLSFSTLLFTSPHQG